MSGEFIVAEFKGTYLAPHPDGHRDQKITKPFHVKVKMERSALKAPGLNGLFATYYKGFLRRQFPEMVDTYMFELVQATEVDGSPIDDPKALSYEALLKYISKKDYPINTLLYTASELRNEVILYEEDPKGQQYLEKRRQAQTGSMLETAAKIQDLDDVLVVVTSPAPEKQPAGTKK